jgi:hypothetical protein
LDSIDTININVQKMFLKLSYKKNKIALQDIYLTKQEGPKGALEEDVLAREIFVVPNDRCDEELDIESKEDVIETNENKKRKGIKRNKKKKNYPLLYYFLLTT